MHAKRGGARLVIINNEPTEQDDIADLVIRHDIGEVISSGRTLDYASRIYLTTGDPLYSNRSNVLLRIVEDTVGVNDVICGSCSYALDVVRYGEERAAPGCMENFTAAVEPWGLQRRDIPMCFNIFLRYLVEPDGAVSIDHEPPSRAGDHMTLRAERDLLVAISNCPQENNPCTGFNPTPLRVTVTPAA